MCYMVLCMTGETKTSVEFMQYPKKWGYNLAGNVIFAFAQLKVGSRHVLEHEIHIGPKIF